jgi:hypothetical protein
MLKSQAQMRPVATVCRNSDLKDRPVGQIDAGT